MDTLADIWTQADSGQRQAITAANHSIEQRLRSDPLIEGESRSKGHRITFVPPLAVLFRVEPGGQTVSVLQVRLFRRRTP
ncbi:MAG TPA: hypothetical protein VN688_34075 [Gemmataceae bacterium]|nr:hypothetical protein [Gemmataceae bacterium]